MSAHLIPATPSVLRRCYFAELSAATTETILQGRWEAEVDFLRRFDGGIQLLKAITSDETDNDVLGLVGLARMNLSAQCATLFHARYANSVRFWDGYRAFTSLAFSILPLRRIYVEVPDCHATTEENLPDAAQLHVRLPDYLFMDGALRAVGVWSIDWERG